MNKIKTRNDRREGSRSNHSPAAWIERRIDKTAKSFSKRRDKFVHKVRNIFFLCRALIIPRKRSTLFIGYAEAALGLGESFRNMLAALDRAGIEFSIYPYNWNVSTRRVGPFLEHRYDLGGVYDINVIYVSADQLRFVSQDLNKQMSGGAYNILRTYWELPRAPIAWASEINRFDELWVPNDFVTEAFRPIFKGIITTIPVCVNIVRQEVYSRKHFELEDDAFYFIFSFDYYSEAARKNPIMVVQAFIYAFQNRDLKVKLIIKASGPETLDPTVACLLTNFARIDPRIKLISRSLKRDEMLSLLDACDCYVSLHRSEGFGAGMAEAMALGKAVIGTDFSGNREFLNSKTGFPAPFTLRPLAPGEYPMGDTESWAEPDIVAAVDLMRRVFNDGEERRRRALEGQRYIESRHSASVVARIIDVRLREIRGAKGLRKCVA